MLKIFFSRRSRTEMHFKQLATLTYCLKGTLTLVLSLCCFFLSGNGWVNSSCKCVEIMVWKFNINIFSIGSLFQNSSRERFVVLLTGFFFWRGKENVEKFLFEMGQEIDFSFLEVLSSRFSSAVNGRIEIEKNYCMILIHVILWSPQLQNYRNFWVLKQFC